MTKIKSGGGGDNTLKLSSEGRQNDRFPILGGGYDTQKLPSGDPRMAKIPSGGGKTP